MDKNNITMEIQKQAPIDETPEFDEKQDTKEISNETPDVIIVDGIEYKRKKTEDLRKYRQQYYKDYYQKNKEKYQKGHRPGMRGKRGLGKRKKWKVSVLGDEGCPLMTQNYTSLQEVAYSLKLPLYTVTRIKNGLYLESNRIEAKKYTKYQIDKIPN